MYEKMKAKVNWPVTILLFIGLITVAFPLYMTIVIAFKQPSEMTNSISGILSLPNSWSLSNFAQAMELTDFWRSLGTSLMVTAAAVILSLLIHSLNEQRNQMIKEQEPTDAVDEILLKIIDAPIARERKGWWRSEER